LSVAGDASKYEGSATLLLTTRYLKILIGIVVTESMHHIILYIDYFAAGLSEVARVEPEVRAGPQHHGRVGAGILWGQTHLHTD
jgi:hypothetical protein